MMLWFRWHHGTVNDPKWRVVAKRADASVADVLAVWATMLEAASTSDDRGSLSSWSAEDVAAALDLDVDMVERIRVAMDGKVISDGRVTAWRKRNPEREDNSTERVRRFREKASSRNDVKRNETQSNAEQRAETLDKTREEETIEEQKQEQQPAPRRRGRAAPFMGSVTLTWRKHHPDADPPPGTANALRPLYARFSEEQATALLDEYLTNTPSQFRNLHKFAATAGVNQTFLGRPSNGSTPRTYQYTPSTEAPKW